MEERKGLYSCIKKVLVPILTVALVSTSALLISGGLSVGSVAYAAGDTVTVKASLKSIDSTTTDKVELTVSISENAAALSGIQMRIKYPEEFDIIETKDCDFFGNGISFFGEDGANPMYCSFGSHGADGEPSESTTRVSGDLVKFTFEANQILNKGTAYTFGIEEKDSNENITLEAFVLTTDEDGYPWTYYLNVVDASPELKYTPTTSGGDGVTVSGTAVSWNSDTDDVTVQLFAEDSESADYTATVNGNTVAYSIPGVAAGTYTMKVMKKNHVTRTYDITVGADDVEQDVKICLLGDVTGDGKIKINDVASLYSHFRNTAVLSGYELACGDVAGNDSKIKINDVAALYSHFRGAQSLWK